MSSFYDHREPYLMYASIDLYSTLHNLVSYYEDR